MWEGMAGGWRAQHGHLALSRLRGRSTCVCLFNIHSYLTIRVSKMALNVISLLFLTHHRRTAKLAGDQEIHPRSFSPDQIISSQIPDHQSPEFGLLLPAKAKAGGVWLNDEYKEEGWRGRGRRPAEDRLVQACAVS